jgi:hypothetical protein
MRFILTDSERDTLQKTLDFACSKMRGRVNNSAVVDAWEDTLAIRIAEEKIRLLRDKLFPPQTPQT